MNNENTSSNDINTTRVETFPQPRKSSGKRVWLFACGTILLLFACICSVLTIFSGSFSSMSGSFAPESNLNILETKVAEYGDEASFTPSKIAVIDVNGIINYALEPDATTTNQSIRAQLMKAKNDSNVKAIIMRLNTPGGAVNAADPICRDLRETNKTKPVYTFIDTMGASLGYLMASCTKFIYSRPVAEVGSIGVKASGIDYSQALKNIGIEEIEIPSTASKNKIQKDITDPTSPEYKALVSRLDEYYEVFFNIVWEGRKDKKNALTQAKLREMADGRVYSGNQALKEGLVDQVAEYEDAAQDIIKKEKLDNEKIELVEYKIQQDSFASLFGATAEIYSLLSGKEESKKIEIMFIK